MAVAESSGIEFIGMPFTMIVSRDGELMGAYIGELHQSHLDDIVAILTRLDDTEITATKPRRPRPPLAIRYQLPYFSIEK